jgi:hypothetical protein
MLKESRDKILTVVVMKENLKFESSEKISTRRRELIRRKPLGTFIFLFFLYELTCFDSSLLKAVFSRLRN